MGYIKQEFIKRILQDEGERLKKYQGLEIEKRLQFHTGGLFNNRTFTVTGAGEMGGLLSFTHTARERFLDIKRKMTNKSTNRTYTRSYRIHNRFVFGHYQSIATRLMYDFTDDVAEQIKSDFKSATNG
nr:hypothetical protein [uncultured Pedobacter sp.]